VADGHTTAPERLVVALVRGVHGLRGAVRVEVLTDRPEVRFVPGAVLFREDSEEPLRIASAEAVADGPGWRLRFEEVRSREAADSLRGAYLEATLVPDAELARGEVYWHEVIGVTVVGVDGAELGTVEDIYRVAENEV
jgi:16S rRNA processing protein RimM